MIWRASNVVPIDKKRKRVFVWLDIDGNSGTIVSDEMTVKVDFTLSEAECTAPIICTKKMEFLYTGVFMNKGDIYIWRNNHYSTLSRTSVKKTLLALGDKIFKKGKSWWYSDDPLVYQFCLEAEKNKKISPKVVRKFFDLLMKGEREEAQVLLITETL